MSALHPMLHVGNPQRSTDCYIKVLDMKLLRTNDNPEYKYTLAFVDYGSNPDHAELELTYNYDVANHEQEHRVRTFDGGRCLQRLRRC